MCEIADRVEQFANRFVPKAKDLTARLVSSRRWAEIDANQPDAVVFRKEIVIVDPEFKGMLNDLMKLAKDCEAYVQGNTPLDAPVALADKQRIAAAVGEMTAVVKEYTKQRERDTALPKWLTNCGILRRSDTSSTHVLPLQSPASPGANIEILIGSRRFHG